MLSELKLEECKRSGVGIACILVDLQSFPSLESFNVSGVASNLQWYFSRSKVCNYICYHQFSNASCFWHAQVSVTSTAYNQPENLPARIFLSKFNNIVLRTNNLIPRGCSSAIYITKSGLRNQAYCNWTIGHDTVPRRGGGYAVSGTRHVSSCCLSCEEALKISWYQTCGSEMGRVPKWLNLNMLGESNLH